MFEGRERERGRERGRERERERERERRAKFMNRWTMKQKRGLPQNIIFTFLYSIVHQTSFKPERERSRSLTRELELQEQKRVLPQNITNIHLLCSSVHLKFQEQSCTVGARISKSCFVLQPDNTKWKKAKLSLSPSCVFPCMLCEEAKISHSPVAWWATYRRKERVVANQYKLFTSGLKCWPSSSTN